MSQKSSLMKTPQYVPKALTSDTVVLVRRNVAVLAEGAAHVAGCEEDGPGAEPAPVDQLLARVVEEARNPGA